MTGASVARAALGLLSPLLGPERAKRAVARAYAVVYLVFYYLSAQYGKAVLGLLWVAITPALFLVVYLPVLTLVFKAKLPHSDDPMDYALFIVAGFLPWGAFADGFGQGASSIVANAGIVRHSPSPPGLLPVVKVSSAFAGLLVSILIFVPVLAAFGRFPGIRLVLLPVAVTLLYVFTLGLAWFASCLTVYARDLLQLVPTLLMVEFLACPVIYHPDNAPGLLGSFVHWNPLTPFLALFRAAVAPTAEFAWADLGLASLWAVVMLVVGAFTFRRLEDGFGDTL